MRASTNDIPAIKRELREKLDRSRAILDKAKAETRELTADEEREYRGLEAETDALDKDLRETEENAEISRRARRGLTIEGGGRARPSGTRFRDLRTGKEVRALLPGESFAAAMEELGEYRRDPEIRADRFMLGFLTGRWDGAEREHRMLQAGSASAGGNLLPAPIAAEVIDLARSQSVVVRMGAQSIPMTSSTLALATITGDPTATWYGEEVRASGLTESAGSFGRHELQAHTLAVLERISIELAEDAPNASQLLLEQIGKVLGLALDRAVLYGITAQGWSGLRDWQTNGPSFAQLNEVDMGTNGAAITTFAPFISAIQKVLEGNYAGELSALGVVMAPRTWGAIEGLTDQQDQPLRPPPSYEQLKKLTSTQCSITETQGNVSTASTAFLGDWSKVLIGMRTDITLEASRVGDDAFKRLHVLLRGYMRSDWTVTQPKHLTRIIGVIP